MTVMSIKTFCSSVLYLALPCFFTGFGIDTCLGNDVRWSDLVDEGATDGEDVYTTSIDGGDVFVFDVFPIGGEDAFIFDVVPLSGLIKEYKRLADQGDAVYQFEYGSALMRGVSVRRNLNKAAAYFKLSADQGNMCGMLNYAFCLEHGAGVERDPSKAVRIYANLNKRGDLSGKYNYARCLERGIGIRVNKSLAIKYYSCLADLSEFEENSCTRLLQGIMIYKHPLEAVSYYKFLADLGHASAQYNYAFCLEKGKGVEKDLAEAARYFGLSANQGFCRAQAKYGFYLKSAGYICEAAEYFRLAAAQNDKYGLYDYARCLEYGSGVSMDLQLAKDYYIRAGEQGHSFATEAIGRVNYKLINSRPPRAIEVERPAHRLYQAATVGEVQPQALTIDRTRPQAITIVMSRATTSDRPE